MHNPDHPTQATPQRFCPPRVDGYRGVLVGTTPYRVNNTVPAKTPARGDSYEPLPG